ncbi:MAG: undecaprenyl/decaprenyl-phosphate alpha-N-acetylglucosaminyl 1-phosphate transferase [Candidatus Gracilibacteria bacterium]|nr:undecaprenyl/decaprenyl-phosphate alpha-N-acetylglucosaminyl 1-phosphate transferase [Candidatus Gracilibacteria bacterium]
MQEIFGLFVLSFCLTFGLIEIFKRIFKKLNFIDNPKKYGYKREPVPYGMGIIFIINLLILALLFIEPNEKLGLILGFGSLVTAVSFIDDRVEVSAKIRLLIQIIIGATIAINSIKIGYISNIFGGIINLETYFIEILNLKIYLIPLIFTIVWYVLIFNAMNWTDGERGMTLGVSFISYFVLFILAFMLFNTDTYQGGIENAVFIMKLTSILMGSVLIFWFYEVKEKLLLGDSGTMFLGFMLASLAIISGGKIATVFAVFGIYLVDAFYVIINRLMRKQNPLKGDFTHLHHRLHKLGLTKYQILSIVYSLSLIFGISALFLDKTGKIIVFIIIALLVVFMTKILEKFKINKK